MSIQEFEHPLAAGIRGAGSSLSAALQQRGERKYQKGVKEEDFQRQQNQLAADRKRQALYGGALNEVLAEVGQIDSIEKSQQAEAGLISRGVPQDIAHKMLEPATTTLIDEAKEIGKAKTEQDKLKAQQDYSRELFGGEGGDLAPLDNSAAEGMPRSITSPDGVQYSENKINQMMASNHIGDREVGKSYRDRLNKIQSNYLDEQRDIRKSNTDRIEKHAEPFNDRVKLRRDVNRLNEVESIIKNQNASFDQNFWRVAAQGLLADKNMNEMSNLFKNDAQRKLFGLLRPFFSTKEIGGSNPSTKEVLITLSTLPSGTQPKQTNEYITKLLKNEAELLLEQANIINEIRDEDQTFAQYQRKIDERIAPFQEQKQQELVRLNEVQAAETQLKRKKPKRGHSFVLGPDGNVRELKDDVVSQAVKSGGIKIK